MINFAQTTHPELYYEEKTNVIQYGYEPFGAPDVQRLAAGDSRCWPKPSNDVVIQKKTLILVDWWASVWEETVLADIKLLLSDLIDEQFNVYVWQQTEFVTLLHGEDLEEDVDRQKITPEHDNRLYDKAYQLLGLGRTKVFLLYRPQLLALLGYSSTYSRTIPASYFDKGFDTQRLKALNHGSSLFFFSHMSTSKSDNISCLKERWPELTFLGEESLITFHDNVREKIEVLSLNINCDGCVTDSNGSAITSTDSNLMLTDHLKCLTMNIEVENIECLANFSLPLLSGLRQLRLNINLDEKESRESYMKGMLLFIMKCLASCSQLQCLSIISNLPIEIDVEETPTIHLPDLCSMHIKCIDLSYLTSALKLPKLNHLSMDNVSVPNDLHCPWPIQSLTLDNLELNKKAFVTWCGTCIYSKFKSRLELEPSLSDTQMPLLSLTIFRVNTDIYRGCLREILECAPDIMALTIKPQGIPADEEGGYSVIQLQHRKKLKYVSFDAGCLTLDFLNRLPLHGMNRIEIDRVNPVDLSKEVIDAMNQVHQVHLNLLLSSTFDEFDNDETIQQRVTPLPACTTLHSVSIDLDDWDGGLFVCNMVQHILQGAICLKYLSTEDSELHELGQSYLPSILPSSIEALKLRLIAIEPGTFNSFLYALTDMLRALPNLNLLYFEPDLSALPDDALLLSNLPSRDVALYQELMQLNHLYIDPTYDFRLKVDARKQRDDIRGRNTSTSNDEIYDYDNLDTNDSSEPSTKRRRLELSSSSKIHSRTVNLGRDLSKQSYSLTRIFYDLSDEKNHPHPGEYRLQVYQETDPIGPLCALKQSGDLLLDASRQPPVQYDWDTFVYQEKKPGRYYGKQSITLSGDWQPLASLSTRDCILGYKVEPEYAVEIHYSHRDDLYFIRSQQIANVVSVTLEFVLEKSFLSPVILPQSLGNMIQFFKSFGRGKLNMERHIGDTDAVYLQKLMNQNVGSCEQRALLFYAMMQMNYEHHRCRIIDNDCHTFVEVLLHDATGASCWVTYDLGGYEAETRIHDMLQDDACDFSPYKKQFMCFFQQMPAPLQPYYDETRTYLASLITSKHRTRLISVHVSQLHALHLEIEAYAKEYAHPIYYIHSPDDLRCSASFIKRINGAQGQIMPGPGGRLHDFLTHPHSAGPVPIIVVNYQQFKADDMVRCNALLDRNQRIADGTPVPHQYLILGLMDTKSPNAYSGTDFYSRFDDRDNCPLNFGALPQILTPVGSIDTNAVVINLCHSMNWQAMLMGTWRFVDGEPVFEEGELALAVKTGRPILIQNPPQDETFDLFWHMSRVRGRFETREVSIPYPVAITLSVFEGYDWSEAAQHLVLDEITSQPFILNPTRLSYFLNQYELDKDGRLTQTLGLIAKQHALNRPMTVFVTRTLSEDDWGLFFKTLCKYPQLKLHVQCAPNVTLPKFMQDLVLRTDVYIPNTSHTQCFQATDSDLQVARFMQESDSCFVLDISECTSADLLMRLSVSQSAAGFVFQEHQQALRVLLNNNQTVILRGVLSRTLLDELVQLIWERTQASSVLGRLYLVSTDAIDCLYNQVCHPDIELKQAILIERGFSAEELQILDALWLKEPLVRLEARLNYQRINKHASIDACFEGMLSGELIPHIDAHCNLHDATAATQQFFSHRLTQVQSGLTHAPYVFLSGLTGVGKSQFVATELQSCADVMYGQNIDAMRAWAQATTDKQFLILFIDEANLSPRGFSECEGLFQRNPGILIDGTYYPLSRKHRVIFAGNPLSYGDRQLAMFFQRHGQSIVFQPLPAMVVFEKTMRPMMPVDWDFEKISAVATPILEIYTDLLQQSIDEVLISPRDVQSMLLHVIHDNTRYLMNTVERCQRMALYHAIRVAKDILPSSRLAQFDLKWPLPKIKRAIFRLPSYYEPYESRHPLIQELLDYFSCRSYQRRMDNSVYHALRFGGKNRFVIEGEPGVGKSELLQHVFGFLNIQEAWLHVPIPAKRDVFYRISPLMDVRKQEDILLHAFDTGAIVLIDEINSMPLLEQYLNALLEGRHPVDGRAAIVAGFRVIGTQNPASMAGRRVESPALKNRSITRFLAPLPKEELDVALWRQGLQHTQKRQALVGAFFQAKKTVALSMRDAFRLARDVIDEDAFDRLLDMMESDDQPLMYSQSYPG